MCGIVGGMACEPIDWLRDRNSQGSGDDRLARATDLLAHRGPDDRGEHVTRDARAFLGHRRLSIIDLAGGHQPIADESGLLRLSYNGEIYNFRELRAALVKRGHTFRTQTDGETALHLYEEDPQRFVDSLQGMFAIAILDERANRLTLVRDRNGIKPLYYHCDGQALVFASELKAILALLPNRPALSAHALREYLRWKYIPAPLTIFEGVHKLPAGHLLSVEPDAERRRLKLDLRCYWEPNYDGPKLSDEREAVELLDQKLRSAVESHLESDVEVGALLSGGVDSSLVAALASTVSGRRIKTFSVGFKERGFDELRFARVLAERYHTEHHEEYVDLDPLAAVPKLVGHFDEPFADSSALACYRVCEVASRHVKVALTGDGGDETFAGYHRYEDVRQSGRADPAWKRAVHRAVFAAAAAAFSPEAKFLRRYRARTLPARLQHEDRRVLCSRWLTDRLLTDAYRSADGPDMFDQLRQSAMSRGWTPVEVAQYVDLRMLLPEDMLTKVDRMSMACSLECRVPLLDHAITEFSTRLADDLRIRDGVPKYLLKRVAERYVPAELLYRKKMGFRVPIRRWFKGELLDRTADLLRDGTLVARGIVDPAGLAWVVRQQPRPWMNLANQLWALLFLEHWARKYLDSST